MPNGFGARSGVASFGSRDDREQEPVVQFPPLQLGAVTLPVVLAVDQASVTALAEAVREAVRAAVHAGVEQAMTDLDEPPPPQT